MIYNIRYDARFGTVLFKAIERRAYLQYTGIVKGLLNKIPDFPRAKTKFHLVSRDRVPVMEFKYSQL